MPPQDHYPTKSSFIDKLLQPLFALGDAATAACDPESSSSLLLNQLTLGYASKIPAALIIVVIGVILTLSTSPTVLSSLTLGPSTPQVIVPSAADWRIGILRAGLPQLSLTCFNSVISGELVFTCVLLRFTL